VQTDEIIAHANELIRIANTLGENDYAKFRGIHARVSDFLVSFAGKNSSFLSQIENGSFPSDKSMAGQYLAEILNAYVAHLESGLIRGLSPKRQAEIDVTSDFLHQAQGLLRSTKVHPAAPAVLIGASLEEFLRNWTEDLGLSLGNKKPGIDAYSSTLREAELITKQDVKDIAAWAGIRNHAAHGEWEELGGAERIRLMLDGVNLFMRKYAEH
jgi:hypothetical protein